MYPQMSVDIGAREGAKRQSAQLDAKLLRLLQSPFAAALLLAADVDQREQRGAKTVLAVDQHRLGYRGHDLHEVIDEPFVEVRHRHRMVHVAQPGALHEPALVDGRQRLIELLGAPYVDQRLEAAVCELGDLAPDRLASDRDLCGELDWKSTWRSRVHSASRVRVAPGGVPGPLRY